jgi:hypothetical protein
MAFSSPVAVQSPKSVVPNPRARFLIAIVLALLPLIYFYPAVFGQVTLAPGDGWTQNFGVRVLIGRMITAGQAPLWNPFIFAGMPLLASIYPGALYPPNWVFALFASATAMNIVVITTYHLALIGTYLYARRIGITRSGALIAGIAFTFGGYMIAHLGHTSRIAAAAWLPWILLAVEELYCCVRWRWVCLGALFIALQLFAGEPQMNCYTIIVVGAYGLFSLKLRPALEQRRSFLFALIAMGGCGALLAMIQLLPEYELLRLGERVRIEYDYFAQFSFPPRQIFALLAPYFFGGALLAPYRVPYWGQWNVAELCGYVGMIPLLLTMVAIVGRERMALFWAFIAVMALLLAFGSYLPFSIHKVLHRVPIYKLFRASGRHMFEFTFALGILAGLGLDALAGLTRQMARRAVIISSAVMTLAVAVTVIVYVFYDERLARGVPLPPQAGSLANPEIYLPIIFFVISLLLLWLAHWRGGRALLVNALLAVTLLLDLAAFGFFFEWRRVDFDVNARLADPPPVAFIKAREPDWHTLRILSHARDPLTANAELLNYPNLSIARGLQSVNGYDSLRLQRVAEVAGAMTLGGQVSAASAFASSHQGFNLLNAKYLLCECPPSDDKTIEIAGVRFAATPSELLFSPGTDLQWQTHALATELVVISTLRRSDKLSDGTPVVRVTLRTTAGRVIERDLQAGRDTAEWAIDRADVRTRVTHRRAQIAESWNAGDFQGHRYLARLAFDRAEIASIEMQYVPAFADITLARISLYDAATQSSQPLDPFALPPARWRELAQFGPVKLYENLQTLPRVWLAPHAVVLPSAAVLQTIKTGRLPDGALFDPLKTVLLEREFSADPQLKATTAAAPDAQAQVTRYTPHRIDISVRSAQPRWLVLSEVYYPGWEARLDGKPVPIECVDYTLRGVRIPAGNHELEFVFRAHSFYWGALCSLACALLLLLGAVTTSCFQWRNRVQSVDR